MAKKINNAGEKLGMSIKDLRNGGGLTKENFNDFQSINELLSYVKKDNIWSKPNFEKLAEQYDPFLLLYVKHIRDTISSKPKIDKINYFKGHYVLPDGFIDVILKHYKDKIPESYSSPEISNKIKAIEESFQKHTSVNADGQTIIEGSELANMAQELLAKIYTHQVQSIKEYFDLDNPKQTSAELYGKIINIELFLEDLKMSSTTEYWNFNELNFNILSLNSSMNMSLLDYNSKVAIDRLGRADFSQSIGEKVKKMMSYTLSGIDNVIQKTHDSVTEKGVTSAFQIWLRERNANRWSSDITMLIRKSFKEYSQDLPDIEKETSTGFKYKVKSLDHTALYEDNYLANLPFIQELGRQGLGLVKIENKKDDTPAKVEKKEEDLDNLSPEERLKQQQKENKKTIDKLWSAPHLESIKRIGPNWRKGRDITADEFYQEFGFRGVEFGEWLPDKERQQVLNLAYDSYCDIAYIFDVDRKSLSLSGMGMAFGSRGRGGIKAAMAHYEPVLNVINLTRLKGAGTLMHEFWHAIDFNINGNPVNYPARHVNKSKIALDEIVTPQQNENFPHKNYWRNWFIDKAQEQMKKDETMLSYAGKSMGLYARIQPFKQEVLDTFNQIAEEIFLNKKNEAAKKGEESLNKFIEQANIDTLLSGEHLLSNGFYDYLNKDTLEKINANLKAILETSTYSTLGVNKKNFEQYRKDNFKSVFATVYFNLTYKHFPEMFELPENRLKNYNVRDLGRRNSNMENNVVHFSEFYIKRATKTVLEKHLGEAKYSEFFRSKVKGYSKQYYDSLIIDRCSGGKDYWATDAEMFARAGEGYIEEKLRLHGIVNQYLQKPTQKQESYLPLTYGVDALPEEDMYFSPYPAKEELNGIVKVYDKLLADNFPVQNLSIEQKEAKLKEEGYEIEAISYGISEKSNTEKTKKQTKTIEKVQEQEEIIQSAIDQDEELQVETKKAPREPLRPENQLSLF